MKFLRAFNDLLKEISGIIKELKENLEEISEILKIKAIIKKTYKCLKGIQGNP